MVRTVQYPCCYNDQYCTVSPLFQWFELPVSASLFQLFELYSTAVPCLLNCVSELYSIYFIVSRTGQGCRVILIWQIKKSSVLLHVHSDPKDYQGRATSTFTQFLRSKEKRSRSTKYRSSSRKDSLSGRIHPSVYHLWLSASTVNPFVNQGFGCLVVVVLLGFFWDLFPSPCLLFVSCQ